MLYQHKKTGARVKKVCSYEDGEYFMVEDQDGKIFTAFDHELILDKSASTKVKTLQIKDKAAKEEPRSFPPETRLNIKWCNSTDDCRSYKRNRFKDS